MSDKCDVSRIYAQGSSSRCLFVMECNMAKNLENTIKYVFKDKFKLHKGSEYFEGDELEMTDKFIKICVNHRIHFCLSKMSIYGKQKENQHITSINAVKKKNILEESIKNTIYIDEPSDEQSDISLVSIDPNEKKPKKI